MTASLKITFVPGVEIDETVMHKIRPSLNIPTEIVRTIVAVAETGSISKAGERLGLSQPAVSMQVKRLQRLIGGELFVRTASGMAVTALGKRAVLQSRRILEANDQLLRLNGNADGLKPLRFGIAAVLAEEFIKRQFPEEFADTMIPADLSSDIVKGVLEGYIDVAYVCGYQLIKVEGQAQCGHRRSSRGRRCIGWNLLSLNSTTRFRRTKRHSIN